MGSIQKTVHYCCVWRGNRVLSSYSGGNREIEDLAALCIEKTPQFHSWYFETYNGRIFGFLIEEACVYFAIFDDGFNRHGVLQFLASLKDEFKKVARKVSKGNISRINATALQEKLAPVIRRLITSLEQTSLDWPVDIRALDNRTLSPSPINNGQQVEATTSTKAPLLGRNNNHDKKKNKDHVVVVRDIEMEEHRRSTDRGVRTESSSSQNSSAQKDSGSVKNRSSSNSQSSRKKWCRQVRIVLAIDAAVCAVLFIIWLTICLHTDCMR